MLNAPLWREPLETSRHQMFRYFAIWWARQGRTEPVATTEEMSKGTGHFDFSHETKHDRRVGAQRLSDCFGGGE